MSDPLILQARNFYVLQAHNRRMTWLLIFAMTALLIFIGWGLDHFYFEKLNHKIGFPVITCIALASSIVLAITSLNSGASSILSSANASPVNPANPDHRQLLNVVKEMSIASGLPMPQVYIIHDDDPNAFATGKDPQHSSVAITEGLLKTLDRDELQGVIAHEMSHIRNYDIRFMMVVAAFIGVIVLISDITAHGLRFRTFSGERDRSSNEKNPAAAVFFIVWIITIVLAPLITRIMAMMVSRKREYLADASAAELTRNPLALAKALQKLDTAAAPTTSIKRGVAHLCVVDPLERSVNEKEGFLADLFATHPPIQKRIMLLKAMAYQRIK
jgi:heat shock protein HtpX